MGGLTLCNHRRGGGGRAGWCPSRVRAADSEYFPTMACNNSYGIPVFSQPVCDYQIEHMDECLSLIERCYAGERGICVAYVAPPVGCNQRQRALTRLWAPLLSGAVNRATLKCNTLFIVPIKFNRGNPYDVRVPCAERGLCYDFSAVVNYLQSDAVMQELGTVGHRWKECNYRINLRFQLIGGDWMRPYVYDVPALLDEAGVRVLVYAGAPRAAWCRRSDPPEKRAATLTLAWRQRAMAEAAMPRRRGLYLQLVRQQGLDRAPRLDGQGRLQCGARRPLDRWRRPRGRGQVPRVRGRVVRLAQRGRTRRLTSAAPRGRALGASWARGLQRADFPARVRGWSHGPHGPAGVDR